MNNSYQKTAKDTLIYGLTTVLMSVIGLIQLPLLTKTIGAYGYGLWSQVTVTIGLMSPFTALGLAIALVRFLAAEKNRKEIQEGFYSIIIVVCGVSAFFSLLMIFFASPIANSFFEGEIDVVRLSATLVFVSAIEPMYLNLIRTFQQIKAYSILTLVEVLGQLGLIALFTLNGYGVTAVILSVLAVRMVMIFILFFMVKAQIGIKIPNFSKMGEFLKLSLPTIPRRVGFWLVNIGDRYIIGLFWGVSHVGIYSAAYGLGNIIYLVQSVFTFILLAPLSRLYDEGKISDVITHLTYSLKYYLVLAIPFCFGSLVLAKPILNMLSTPDIANEGSIITPVIAVSVTVLGVTNILSNILILVKKPKISAYIWTLVAILNVGLNFVLVPSIGILGAAMTTLAAYALALCITIFYSVKEFRFSIHWFFIVKSLIASMVMSVFTWFMHNQWTLNVILIVTIGVLVYSVILISLRGFSKEEYKFFISILRNRS